MWYKTAQISLLDKITALLVNFLGNIGRGATSMNFDIIPKIVSILPDEQTLDLAINNLLSKTGQKQLTIDQVQAIDDIRKAFVQLKPILSEQETEDDFSQNINEAAPAMDEERPEQAPDNSGYSNTL